MTEIIAADFVLAHDRWPQSWLAGYSPHSIHRGRKWKILENHGNSWKITYKWGGFPLPRLIAGEYVHIVAILVDYMGVSRNCGSQKLGTPHSTWPRTWKIFWVPPFENPISLPIVDSIRKTWIISVRWLVSPLIATDSHTPTTGWWFQPLWKIWVRQLGWFFPIYHIYIYNMESRNPAMFQTTNQPFI